MLRRFETVGLITQPSIGSFTVDHYAAPDIKLTRTLRVNAVRALVLADGSEIKNPDHSTAVSSLQIDGDLQEETITLPGHKAERLAELFQGLRPQHDLQCHDIVTAVEGWEHDLGLELTQKAVRPAGQVEEYEEIISGNPYTVQILRGLSPEISFARTHSCVGTDNGRLLGLMGKGLVLTTMDPETTRAFYANGANYSFLARTVLTQD